MCWITLTPKPARHHHSSEDGSSMAELVRVHKKGHGPRYSKVHIIAPADPDTHSHNLAHLAHHHHHHHHHRHPHIHPLHLNPPHLPHAEHNHHWKLHGHGKKRTPAPPTSAPPPSRSPSLCPSPREPMYKTQIVEPARTELRETTRIALREVRPNRGRLRTVAGYEVLGNEVPWDWDCLSSAASGAESAKDGGPRRRVEKLRYPPFGDVDRWM